MKHKQFHLSFILNIWHMLNLFKNIIGHLQGNRNYSNHICHRNYLVWNCRANIFNSALRCGITQSPLKTASAKKFLVQGRTMVQMGLKRGITKRYKRVTCCHLMCPQSMKLHGCWSQKPDESCLECKQSHFMCKCIKLSCSHINIIRLVRFCALWKT